MHIVKLIERHFPNPKTSIPLDCYSYRSAYCCWDWVCCLSNSRPRTNTERDRCGHVAFFQQTTNFCRLLPWLISSLSNLNRTPWLKIACEAFIGLFAIRTALVGQQQLLTIRG